jgi:hypothetical protein
MILAKNDPHFAGIFERKDEIRKLNLDNSQKHKKYRMNRVKA